jgi:hypothetical protein
MLTIRSTPDKPIVLTDPNDDPVVYTAVVGRANVLCARDRDFYAEAVVSFCRDQGIEIMDELTLLERLESSEPTPSPQAR